MRLSSRTCADTLIKMSGKVEGTCAKKCLHSVLKKSYVHFCRSLKLARVLIRFRFPNAVRVHVRTHVSKVRGCCAWWVTLARQTDSYDVFVYLGAEKTSNVLALLTRNNKVALENSYNKAEG